jgi:integrase
VSSSSARTASLPEIILPGVREHLAQYVDGQADAFVFTGPTGATIRRGNLNKLLRWQATVAAMGVPGLHFHDLRHTGNTLAASTGASLRDLMARMGHDSPAAAMIYQHATSAADRAIAAAVDKAVRARDQDDQDDPEDGTAGVLAGRR